jgi:flagellar assembly protein FliH
MKKSADRYSFDDEEVDGTAAKKQDADDDLAISQDIVYKAKEDAAVIKREAELEAERILSEANEKAKKLKSETEQEAKEEGYRHGEALAQQHYSELITEAKNYRDQCKNEYIDMLNSLEQDIVSLVVNIAAKVLGDEIRKNQESILGIVRETISACSNHEHILLKVSAEDFDYVEDNRETLLSTVGDLNDLEIRKDGTLEKGSCIIETDYGSVDGSCDTIVENIKQAFFGILQNDSTES